LNDHVLTKPEMEKVHVGSVLHKFKGPGQQNTRVITWDGVLRLIMTLPGINARDVRYKFSSILSECFPEDQVVQMENANLSTKNGSGSALVHDQDLHGNLVLNLESIGLAGALVRFKRYADGVKFAEIDVVKAVTGKDNNNAGELYIRIIQGS
jgi:hypothetical protein